MVGSESWQRVNTQVPVRSPRYAVFNLAEGKEYRFRVVSANMYGTSEPSKPTGPVKTQELRGENLNKNGSVLSIFLPRSYVVYCSVQIKRAFVFLIVIIILLNVKQWSKSKNVLNKIIM